MEVRQEQGAGRGYGRYVFRCADTGIGMSSEFMSKLFQPFERAQDSTNSRVTAPAGNGYHKEFDRFDER